MNRCSNRAVAALLAALGWLTISSQIRAQAPASVLPGPDSPVAAELSLLAAEFERLGELRHAAWKATPDGPDGGGKPSDETLSDEDWLKQGREIDVQSIDPDAQMLPQFIDLAKRNPNSPYAFDALFEVILRGGPQTGDVHGRPWQLKEEAIELVWASHLKDPRLFIVLEKLAEALPSAKTEAFLKRVSAERSDKNVQAAAAYNLARYYATLAHAHARSERIARKEHLLNFERYWKIVITPYLKEKHPLDEERNTAEIDRLLRLVTDKYADIAASDWKLTGPNKIFVEATPFPKPKTFGDLARSLSFELNNVVPGKPAPEIDGLDADGQRFRLSDFKGKVVLIVFSANWCGGCVALHPMQRAIVEKYRNRPFGVLGVNRDEKRDTLRADTASGEITWRCWWDGMHGPIREAWNADGIPRIILLDHNHIFQDVALSRFTPQAELEQAIDTLLEKVRPNTPAQ